LDLQFEYLLGIVVFGCTLGAYLVFLSLGRKWRREYEMKGEEYWKEAKEKRVKELTNDLWRPKLVAISYFMAYFSNGFMKMAFSLWVPLFLINNGVSVFNAALFLGLSYILAVENVYWHSLRRAKS
jgi:hypothetical protein